MTTNVAPGFTGCGKTRNEGRNRAIWGIENHSPHLTDRSWGILTRSLFRDFYKNEFFRSLLSPACADLKVGPTFKLGHYRMMIAGQHVRGSFIESVDEQDENFRLSIFNCRWAICAS